MLIMIKLLVQEHSQNIVTIQSLIFYSVIEIMINNSNYIMLYPLVVMVFVNKCILWNLLVCVRAEHSEILTVYL